MLSSFDSIYRYLPPRLTERIKQQLALLGDRIGYAPVKGKPFVTELRLRAGRPVSVTLSNGGNIALGTLCTLSEIGYTVSRLTDNSLHAHTATIRKGYIRLPDGCRVGVCGRAVTRSQTQSGSTDGTDEIGGISEITSLNIRIAHKLTGVSAGIYDKLKKLRFEGGALFYGPPSSGKTTLLRDIAIRASSGADAIRVAVIDSRGEFRDTEAMRDCLIDLLDGYPKAEGIEQATRTLSPQLIICDEIGNASEAEAILAMQNTGVPLIASAHASTLDALLHRPHIKRLYDNSVFARYIGLARDDSVTGGLRFGVNEPSVLLKSPT